jgi:hypothetical protein
MFFFFLVRIKREKYGSYFLPENGKKTILKLGSEMIHLSCSVLSTQSKLTGEDSD